MQKILKFSDGHDIPILGFGTWQITGEDCYNAVKTALELGYRHIDTADVYGNHKEVGRALKDSGIARDQIFLTTKVWRDSLSTDGVLESAKRFQEELQTDYFDLLLIHWPNDAFPINESLEALKELQTSSIVRSIGVSNFTIPLLEEALKTEVKFVTNQVEFHPSLYQMELLEFCKNHDIVVTAYSPIAQGQDLKIGVISELADKYEKSPAQIVLNWIMKKGIIAIPRSKTPENIKDNLGALEFELEDADSEKIDSLNMHNRIVVPPFAPFED